MLRVTLFGLLLTCCVTTSSQADIFAIEKCQIAPEILLKMPVKTGYLVSKKGKQIFQYRHAKTAQATQFGFQFACPETIQQTQILFEFRTSYTPRFHMQNVYAALDIAFIDENKIIVDIQTMQPYDQASPIVLYQPPQPVRFALEAHAGYFVSKKIVAGDKLEFPVD